MREAMFWEAVGSTDDNGRKRVRCRLCPHECMIAPGARGKCHIRLNLDGVLYAESWGVVPALALDPIEKKPLSRFHSGSYILSAGSYGCNLSCLFCQNHGISQRGLDPFAHGGEGTPSHTPERDDRQVSPADLVNEALALRDEGNIGIAFTYNEPFVGYEYVWDTARLAREKGLLTVLVTNGYVNPAPLQKLLPYINAMNIDLKGFSESFYRDLCGGSLEPVLQTIRTAAESCHVELTTLVIPGENSSVDEIDALSQWIAAINPGIPLHLNRHHPDYLMPIPPPMEKEALLHLAEGARRHLSHVYTGNL